MSKRKPSLNEFLTTYYDPLLNEEFYRERVHDEYLLEGRERSPYQRDYSRILYSGSFRRLQGKMQLLGLQEEQFYRNRLTHSLEVSQVARGIVDFIKSSADRLDIYNEDMYVIEAASLAHDIGNPPFGHHGERILNDLMKDEGGFEGNAQTLRVLNHLEKKLPSERGLNLTKRVLLSVVKYYVPQNYQVKSFIYQKDYNWIKSLGKELIPLRTIDVQIMDLADEIAYGTHDLEDALSLKLFTMDEFIYEFSNESDIKKDDIVLDKLKELIEKSKTFANKARNFSSGEEYSYLFRKDLISNLVNLLIKDIGVIKVDDKFKEKTGTENDYELGFINYGNLAKHLKKITFKNITRSNKVKLYEKQGEKVIKGLFEAYTDKTFNKGMMLLPVEYRTSDKEEQKRSVADYISGMMDSYANQQYELIYGPNSLKRLY